MIRIGNFFFKYRNGVFILFYFTLFLPAPPLFSKQHFGEHYYVWPLIIGLIITISGQIIRGVTIGLTYISRGGKAGRPHADALVTWGIFTHCRNPLYVGNLLVLIGMAILSNSLISIIVIIPLFIFIYQSMVLAEENFLYNKFGTVYNEYCSKVKRWLPNLAGISNTFKNSQFSWKTWILTEYNTLIVWLAGIALVLSFRYPELTNFDNSRRNLLIGIVLFLLLLIYIAVAFYKKAIKSRQL